MRDGLSFGYARIKIMKAIEGSSKTPNQISGETHVSLTTVYRSLKILRRDRMVLVHGSLESGKKSMSYMLRPSVKPGELPAKRVIGAILSSPKSVMQISEQEKVSYTTASRIIERLESMGTLNVSLRINTTNKEWTYMLKPGNRVDDLYEKLEKAVATSPSL
ncbi:MAG: ArsR family transcriptional regulator [Candidatus Micrarchaeota archaeon]|nr:ArsR family transcriptional regulator [Candidatus Micrarchaeota archaeon]